MLVLLLLVLAQDSHVEPVGDFQLPYSADYVGSARCAQCHQDLGQQQRTHHMALTGRSATPGDPLFSEELAAAPVRGFGDNADTPKIPRAGDVSAILGSGAHGLTPVAAAAGRAMREHPLSYSAVRNEWFPTPGSQGVEDPAGSLSPEQTRECLGCHATTISWTDDVLDATTSVFGVQCERCHGPGSAHIDTVTTGGGNELRIFNPERLTANAQVGFCGQCHRQPIDFEPLDVMTRAPGLARHAGVGIMMSRCFRETPPTETITCTQCHSPHQNSKAADSKRYRQTCLRCHSEPESAHTYERVSADSDCISCHMPEETEGFYGLAFADHWIHTPGSPVPLGSQAERPTLDYLELLYRNAWEVASAGDERRSRLALGLAEILFGLERRGDALEWAHDALSYAPTAAQRLKSASMAREGGQLDAAEAILRDAVRIDPNLLRAHFDLGAIAASRGEHDTAIEHFRRALAIRDGFAEGHAGLATSLRQLDRLTEALEHYQEANRLVPDTLGVVEGLAWVLATHPDAASRSPEQAVQLAERAAVATSYGNPVVLDTLGAAYAATGDFETAANAARKAIKIAESAGANELIQATRERLALYQSGRAYVAPSAR